MDFPSRNEDYTTYYIKATKLLIDFVKKNRWATKYFDVEKLKNLLDDDLTPILYSSRADFNEFIDTAYGIKTGNRLLWMDYQSVLRGKNFKDWETDEDIQRYAHLIPLSVGVVDYMTFLYEKANAITLLVPDGRFTVQPLDLKDIQPLLAKLESLNISAIIVNVESAKNKYYPTFVKIYKTEYTARAFEGTLTEPIFDNDHGVINLANPPEVEHIERKATPVWVVDFMDTANAKYSHYKQILLRSSYDDIQANYTKMSKVNLTIPTEASEDLYEYVWDNNPDIVLERVYDDSKVRWFMLKTAEGQEKKIATLRLPASWVMSVTDKYLTSCAFQAIDAFVNRKTVYKKAPEITRTPKRDIILIDEDNINEDKDGSPYIRTLSDIVEYEETNGTVFHTHHASPRRHWVKSHTRHLPNGKETEVQGHWRGKDNKEVIYKLPKRPKSH